MNRKKKEELLKQRERERRIVRISLKIIRYILIVGILILSIKFYQLIYYKIYFEDNCEYRSKNNIEKMVCLREQKKRNLNSN